MNEIHALSLDHYIFGKKKMKKYKQSAMFRKIDKARKVVLLIEPNKKNRTTKINASKAAQLMVRTNSNLRVKIQKWNKEEEHKK